MQDFRALRPSEYSILQAARPLVARLECRNDGATFKEFWELPKEVGAFIAAYNGNLERFEIYEGDEGPSHLLVFAVSKWNTPAQDEK